MNRRPLSRPTDLARALHRRARHASRGREESAFHTELRADAEAPELLLSPHWDDAALNCWRLLASERDLNVVNVFAGIPPPTAPGAWEAVIGARDPAVRARERIAEDRRALARTGRTPLNLALLDAQYRRQRSSTVGLRELDGALAERVQSASHVYAPAGIGGHVDHRLVRLYGRLLLRTGIPVTLYAELPYCTFHGWPSWVDGREPSPRRNVDAYWSSFLNDVPEMPPLRSAEVERLEAPAARAKCAALSCYEVSLNYGVRQLMADPAFHGFEVRWNLESPRVDSDAPETRGRHRG